MSAGQNAFPAERRGTTAAVLKYVAMATMFIDHFAVVFGEKLYAAMPFLNVDGFEILRIIGRIAFPIFAFMIAKGALFTGNIYKYLGRLLAFAFISEIPFDLALFGTAPADLFSAGAFGHQNVFFTLFLGLLSICVYRVLRERNLEALAIAFLLFAAFAAENLLCTDYGAMGVLCIFLFYVFLQWNEPVRIVGTVITTVLISLMLSFEPYVQQAVTVSGAHVSLYHMDVTARWNYIELFSLLSLPLTLTYNGKKGRQPNKWVFYIFYPAHLALLWAVSLLF
jgi:hypothetical protein